MLDRGTGGRGETVGFYEETGAIRDVVENHMLRLSPEIAIAFGARVKRPGEHSCIIRTATTWNRTSGCSGTP